eukprot:CAMPEP_0175078370 /NCGR_PEP_ID=MMETSP0052_2-20121109/24065_1 /TAXON_ID=51329 ORGANISM="Polytomella parva, Strain SAG 63-3" /NCGR_SAMPLE_ID=MMETSP0052_2 /ASSEMBLY_ACC=CAM_ASM_000194 /LENGTH=77 /DNA_ID=CAMNT_0016348253 /DNA_START=56 /DNA_END=289 /DNA_ORIENTATION=-
MSPKGGLPADVMALTVPVGFAAAAFSTWVYRLVRVDPEATQGITEETQAAADRGSYYRNQFRGLFEGRSKSLFNNEP